MQLDDLVGLHKLTGVSYEPEAVPDLMDDATVFNFVLDGITYSAYENGNDGYRSSMDELVQSKFKVNNRFRAVQVLAVMRIGDYVDILDVYDVKSARLVLSVGTDYTDSYYPYFVTEWKPENLFVNIEANKEQSK